MTTFADVPGDTKVFMNGEFINWEDATVHVMTHALHYGSSVFEGIRCYKTPKGPAVFRFHEHMKRLYNSAKMYRMTPEIPVAELSENVLEVIRLNNFEECYIRPIVFRGTGPFGVSPMNNSIDIAVCCWLWGSYLGPEALENGVNVHVSSWNRLAPNTMPALAKCGANYANGQLIKMEALLNGYAEGIALDVYGYVSEGSGENIFIVQGNTLTTTPLGNSVLPGITRDSVMTLAREAGYQVLEAPMPREMLYIADEVFFTGTAAEITPLANIDQIQIGAGKRGPVVKDLQERFFAVIDGDAEDKYGWLTFV
ncbi:MAG: branched-chain amino acid transaminase [Candidatus Lernaella stagnicola]|nr:branched-chain amino acid transaminase [Candidatus Lernaella stagnicola]